MTTLREKVRDVLYEYADDRSDWSDSIDAIADLLEATGAPAYMRVATDLRGEWVDTPPEP